MKLHREDYKDELAVPPHVLRVGENGSGFSKRVQEWINLHRYHTPGFRVSIGIDDDYGKITESAIEDYQEFVGLPVTGEVDPMTWLRLTAPMQRAFSAISCANDYQMKDLMVEHARQMIFEHPTEIGNNTGPWVRAFMKGKEGDWAAWCCGVMSTIMDHSATALGKPMDNWLSWDWSCEKLRKKAIAGDNTTYMSPKEVVNNYELIEPGDLFLVMSKGRAKHIGLVERMKGSIMCTIEGNTNDEGSREGYEFVNRKRKTEKGNCSIIKLL